MAEIIAAVGIFLKSIPLLRRGWRWLWERRIEIEIDSPGSANPASPARGLRRDDDGPILIVAVAPENPHIFAWFDLVLVNHRTNRKERILGIELHLKKRHRLFWKKTLAVATADEWTSGRVDV